jgi:hypothetical protein
VAQGDIVTKRTLGMILVAAVAIGITAACFASIGCATPTHSPSSPPAYVSTSETVYSALVDGGCMQASADGVVAVSQEGAMANPPSWLNCMFQGGSIGDCEAPCR